MIQLARFSLLLAVFCAAYALVASVLGWKNSASEHWMRSAIHALSAIAGLLTFSIGLFLYFLLQRNFALAYVAQYTNVSLPLRYVISALWAGQEGSLLFWTWLLSLCSVTGLRHYRRQLFLSRYNFPSNSVLKHVFNSFGWGMTDITRHLFPVILVLTVNLSFFLILLVFGTNPFQTLVVPPLDGQGLNPLLQNLYMVLHPPLLFLGYACFVIPFALAFGALGTGELRPGWLKVLRHWILLGWFFLGIGILLGAHWAYLELGWGGYWSWDPVENSSLIPWLLATALLHTLILQKRKGLCVRGNIILSILVYAFCILATFITRSGILQSVHAYAQSSTANFFLGSLALIFIGLFIGIVYRRKTLQSLTVSYPLFSHTSSLIFMHQVFLGLAFAISYGTLYPILTEFFTGRHINLTTSFFTTVSRPFGLFLLGLLAAHHWLPCKERKIINRKTVTLLVIFCFSGVFLLFFVGMRNWLALFTCTLSIFFSVSFFLTRTTFLRPATFFHFGIMIILLGITISSIYKIERDVILAPGESAGVADFRFEYQHFNVDKAWQRRTVSVKLAVYRTDTERQVAQLFPEKRFYGPLYKGQVTTEVGWAPSIMQDMYAVLLGWNAQEQVSLRLIVYPMILWIWIGGYGFMTAGFLLYIFSPGRIFLHLR